MFARALTAERAKQHGERDRKRLVSLRRVVRVRSAAGGDEIQQRHVSPTSPRAYLPLLLTVIIYAKQSPFLPHSSPCPLFVLSLGSFLSRVLLALVSPPFPPRVPGHSSLPRGLQSPFIPFSPFPSPPTRPLRRRFSAQRCLLSRVYLQFPRSLSEPGTSRQCPLSIRLSLPRVPPTGSTFPSSRYDSVSVSSIFPLSRCPERLNTNAFIVSVPQPTFAG